MNQRQIVLDTAMAAALIAALAGVYLVDRVSTAGDADKRTSPPVQISVEEETETSEATFSKPLSIAVTSNTIVFDDVGRLLNELGQGYKYTRIPLEDIEDFSKISQYDLLFLTCGTHPKSWLGKPAGGGTRPDVRHYEWNQEVIRKLSTTLRRFLEKGGTIYASDWQYATLSVVFPEYVDRLKVAPGKAQSLEASIVDAGLSEVVGRQQLQLKFDLDDWKPAALSAPKMKIYLEGEYRAMDGRLVSAPLLVKFPYGQGQVIFTSFHNEKQNSEQEMKLLRYLVFAAVTARIETKVSITLVKGGFSPSKQSLLSIGNEAPKVTQKYTNKKSGKLLFVLGFTAEGAELELTVRSPDGTVKTRKGASTLQIELADAVAGDYEYSVMAHKVPYPNFPFTLTIGDK